LLPIGDSFQLFSLEVRGHRFDHRIELAFNDDVELVQRQTDAVVG